MCSSIRITPFPEIASVMQGPTLDQDPGATNSAKQSMAMDPKNTHNEIPQPGDCAKVLRFPVKQSAFHIGAVILGNTFVIAMIMICLHGAAQKEGLSEWEKRAFNFAIIMLSAILSLGIGYLLDQLGLLARGQVLASNPHTELSITYIIRGSMTSVAHLLSHHVLHRPRTFNRVTFIAAMYLAFSISARLSVALLGLTFNVDESLHIKESISISRWPLPNVQFTNVHSDVHNMTLDTLFDYATFAVRIKTSDTEAKNTNLTADANDSVRHVIGRAFSAKDITQTLVPGQPVASYEYKLRQFKGNTTYPSNRTIVVQTECHTYVVRNETIIPGQLKVQGISGGENVTFTNEIFDPKKNPLDGFAAERIFIPPRNAYPSSCGPLCIRIWLWDKFLNTPGEATYQCENSIQLPLNSEGNPATNIQPTLAEYFLRFMGDSESANSDDFRYRDVTDIQGFINFANAIGLDESYENGEIWVAAVLGRFTSMLILYLDEVLPKIQITESSETVRSRLSVHWRRVVMLVAAMTGIQIVIALGTIYYCRRSVLIPDEVSPLGGLIGQLRIPRTSTFTSMVSRSSFLRAEDSTVRAWFSLTQEGGTRRWILEFDKLEPENLGLPNRSRLVGKDGSELKGMQSGVCQL
ncbi:hypothetical protein EV426DRAFT_623297 [Tirmania nivea]|nr:hypothetical protein EV426DRAFT_623297 [Tirmania nivea]